MNGWSLGSTLVPMLCTRIGLIPARSLNNLGVRGYVEYRLFKLSALICCWDSTAIIKRDCRSITCPHNPGRSVELWKLVFGQFKPSGTVPFGDTPSACLTELLRSFCVIHSICGQSCMHFSSAKMFRMSHNSTCLVNVSMNTMINLKVITSGPIVSSGNPLHWP